VKDDKVDTKTLLEWSAKYHTPNYGRTPILLVRGEGMRVWDSDGREYLDFTTGIAVTALGHCHPVVTGAIREAAATLLHVSNIFHTAPQIHLAKLLVEHSFADRVFFCNSGAEANEAALKLARKYGKDKLADDRYEVIATNNSFHGRTLATVTATGQPKYQHGFEPLMPGFKHVPYNDLRAMERAMDSHTAAILVEPIQGEGGVNVPDDDYLPGLRKLCDESGALLIFDEIQTGMGRTGSLWAYEQTPVRPDLLTSAKALGGGLPVGACMIDERLGDVLEPGDHGSTFAGGAVGSAAALAVLDLVDDPALLRRVRELGADLRERLLAVEGVVEVRGRGLMLGVGLAGGIDAAAVGADLLERGLIVNVPEPGTLRLLPPLTVESAQIERAVALIAESLLSCLPG
jgi:acetylornithine/N-succinyldiaminopimelate aminotransferase